MSDESQNVKSHDAKRLQLPRASATDTYCTCVDIFSVWGINTLTTHISIPDFLKLHDS